MKARTGFLFILLVTGLIVSMICATGLGFLSVTPLQVVQAVYARLNGLQEGGIQSAAATIIVDVRLPRIFCAALVGGGLALAGGVFQALLLNPLADPYTLGISSGAAFGASCALILTIFGVQLPIVAGLPVFAFSGALLTLAGVFYMARNDRAVSSNTLILSGIILSSILSAGIGFIQYLADKEVGVIIFWLMGSFVGKTWLDVVTLLVFLLPAACAILYFSRDLNVMALGHAAAATLGVDPAKIRRYLLVSASLITAVCVSVSGVIGFVGLIVPHLLRMVVGPENRVLLPASFLTGALLLLVADTLTRAVLPHELPIGILTALLGGPFFCIMFQRRQSRLHQ